MALTHYIGGKLTGLTVDFPPSLNYPENTTFINTEDFTEFILVAGVWEQVGGFLGIVATGGDITQDGDFKVHTFLTSGTFEIISGSGTVAHLVIAGGGGGGSRRAGAGGAGGYRTDFIARSIASFPITVGTGGAGGVNANQGSNGLDSIFSTITSAGGGGGGDGNGGNTGLNGGSGGGGNPIGLGNTPPVSPVQGFNGGLSAVPSTNAGGGGGGASEIGADAPAGDIAGNGGDGLSSEIVETGIPVFRAGGGGGGCFDPDTAGTGGLGGGGNGGKGIAGVDGTDGTGGGGGGGGLSTGVVSQDGGAGGDGIVILRYFSPA